MKLRLCVSEGLSIGLLMLHVALFVEWLCGFCSKVLREWPQWPAVSLSSCQFVALHASPINPPERLEILPSLFIMGLKVASAAFCAFLLELIGPVGRWRRDGTFRSITCSVSSSPTRGHTFWNAGWPLSEGWTACRACSHAGQSEIPQSADRFVSHLKSNKGLFGNTQ